jgi:hypothetical protein
MKICAAGNIGELAIKGLILFFIDNYSYNKLLFGRKNGLQETVMLL